MAEASENGSTAAAAAAATAEPTTEVTNGTTSTRRTKSDAVTRALETLDVSLFFTTDSVPATYRIFHFKSKLFY